MIPWPIGLLVLFYGAVAALSAALLWKGLLGMPHQSMAWALVWLVLSGGATLGLSRMRLWGRRLAIYTSWLLIISTLAASAVFVAAARPAVGLVITFSSALHYLMIRYLKRPTVVAWFNSV